MSIGPVTRHGSVMVDSPTASVGVSRRDVAAPTAAHSTEQFEDQPFRLEERNTEWVPPRSFGLKAALIASDLIALVLTLVISFSAVYDRIPSIRRSLVAISVAAVLIFLMAFAQQNLYNSRHLGRRAEELRRLVNACALGSMGVAAASLGFKIDPPRTWFVAWTLLSVGLTGFGREVLRRFINHQRASGKLARRVILVGSNEEAEELHNMLLDSSELGYDVVGRVSDTIHLDEQGTVVGEASGPSGDPNPDGGGAPWLGTTDDILEIVRERNASGVVVATTDIDLETANRLVRRLTNEGIYVEMSSAMRDIATRRVTIRPLGRYPVMTVEPVETNGWRAGFKRCFDVVLSFLILLGLAPVMIAAVIAIRVTSGKGVLFRQVRVGRNGVPFTVFKLRTMVHNAEALLPQLMDQNEASGPMFKMTDDPRVTKVGRILRKTSLDEVPQFFNVIRGEMSLVGPRPALPNEAVQWNDDLRERLRVKPGITGNWQINGRYTSSLEDYQRLDMFYVDNWSIVTDLVIMAKTIPAVLKRNGAA